MDLNIPKLVGTVIAGIVTLFCVFSSFYTIDQGDKGVVLTNGAISSEVGPGLHWKFPMVQGVQEISMRSQQVAWNDQAKITAYTRDKQVASIHMVVVWNVTDATKTYIGYRDSDQLRAQILVPKALEILKNSFGRVDSTDAITQRERLNADVLANLQIAVKGYPVQVTGVQITDISFSSDYDNAVAANMKAQVAVLQATAEQRRQNIEADTRLYAAKANADATSYAGQKEAEAIKAKGDALRASPEVVALTAAQRWDGALPQTMVPNATLPMLNLK